MADDADHDLAISKQQSEWDVFDGDMFGSSSVDRKRTVFGGQR